MFDRPTIEERGLMMSENGHILNDRLFKIIHRYEVFKIYKTTTFARVKKIQKKSQHATCVNVGNSARNIQT